MGWFDFLRRRRRPFPADASLVKLAARGGQGFFTVSCCEPATVTPQLREKKRLDLALAVTPGASASEADTLRYSTGDGDAYTFHPYALEVSEANVLALRAACLAWSPEARRAAQRFALGDEDVVRIKDLMVEHFVREHRQALAQPEAADVVERLESMKIRLARRALGLDEPPA